jgi:aerotaxis receptor
MRNNQPVTQREYQFPGTETLMSTTDTASHISYANATFVRTSGYDIDELIGQPHNLVRHPDMPVEAFADMWRSLKEEGGLRHLHRGDRAQHRHPGAGHGGGRRVKRDR